MFPCRYFMLQDLARKFDLQKANPITVGSNSIKGYCDKEIKVDYLIVDYL